MNKRRYRQQAIPCPGCGGRSFCNSLCSKCSKKGNKQGHEMTGVAKERAIAEFMDWYRAVPKAWDRAQQGLMMGIPKDDKTAAWP